MAHVYPRWVAHVRHIRRLSEVGGRGRLRSSAEGRTLPVPWDSHLSLGRRAQSTAWPAVAAQAEQPPRLDKSALGASHWATATMIGGVALVWWMPWAPRPRVPDQQAPRLPPPLHGYFHRSTATPTARQSGVGCLL